MINKDWHKTIIKDTATIREALMAIDVAALQLALIVDSENHLLGLVTDGDIRRGFLRGLSMEDAVTQVMNPEPFRFQEGKSLEDAKLLMQQKEVHHLPVVDHAGKIVDCLFIENLVSPANENIVILMAGGLGSRLRPLTHEHPKPLLKVAGKPIAELLLEEFMRRGFKRFYFSVNYKAEMIRDHFEDGARWGANIDYLQEEKRLGTAGALSLLPHKVAYPIIVANADIMTRLDFSQALAFHIKSNALLTVCVRNYQHTVPYGVIRMEDDRLVRIDEKPVQDFFVSAGIYILNPEVLSKIPKNEYCDMPDLITTLSQEGAKISVFPICEYWLDIGRVEDLERAHHDYTSVF